MTKASAKLRHLHIAPRKVRKVAGVLKGMSVIQAEAELMYRTQRSAPHLAKLLRSAVSNAKDQKLNEDKLVINDIRVDGGPMMKRLSPRAMGRGTIIQKKMSHVTIVLEEVEDVKPVKFVIPEKLTKEKPQKDKKDAKKEKESKNEEPTQEEEEHHQREKKQMRSVVKRSTRKSLTGFAKKVFRRKSV